MAEENIKKLLNRSAIHFTDFTKMYKTELTVPEGIL